MERTVINALWKSGLFVASISALLSIGFATIGLPVSSAVEGGLETTYQFRPAPQCFVAAFACLLIIIGFATRKTLICWIGIAMLSGFAALFFFGVGALYVPITTLLVILVALTPRQ